MEAGNMIEAARSTDFEERRRQDRETLEQRVVVTSLTKQRRSFQGKLVDYSYSGLRLMLPRQFRVGTVLAVEWGNTMVLGEVMYCRAGSSRQLRYAGIRTDYIILDRTLSDSHCNN